MAARIAGFIESSLIEYRGKISSVVFLSGCNFRCPFCHARPLVLQQNRLEEIPLQSVLNHVGRRGSWIDGVVITGGEPTINPDLPDLIARLKELSVAVKLDTNGSNPDMLADLLGRGQIDYVAMDIKAPLDGRYALSAGVAVDLEAIRRSIELLRDGPVPYEFRSTVLRRFMGEDEVRAVARDAIGGAALYYLQAFVPRDCIDASLTDAETYNPDEMKALAAVAAPFVKRCVVRGNEG